MRPSTSTASDANDVPSSPAAPAFNARARQPTRAHRSQPSAGLSLPSSHCSPTSTTPSPQRSIFLQSAEQPSPPLVLPSSHSSPGPTTPSPQRASLHRFVHASASLSLPSSHSSSPPVAPSPHSVPNFSAGTQKARRPAQR